METQIRYTVIKDDKQYKQYVQIADKYIDADKLTHGEEEELNVLTLLIEDYESDNYPIERRRMDPIGLIKSLMVDHGLNNNDIAEVIGVSKSHASEILNYKKSLTLDAIKKTFSKIQNVY